jgi:hypothetical protein
MLLQRQLVCSIYIWLRCTAAVLPGYQAGNSCSSTLIVSAAAEQQLASEDAAADWQQDACVPSRAPADAASAILRHQLFC